MSRRYKYNTLLLENGREVYIGHQPDKIIHILFSNGEKGYRQCCKRWLEKRVVKEYDLRYTSKQKMGRPCIMKQDYIDLFENRN